MHAGGVRTESPAMHAFWHRESKTTDHCTPEACVPTGKISHHLRKTPQPLSVESCFFPVWERHTRCSMRVRSRRREFAQRQSFIQEGVRNYEKDRSCFGRYAAGGDGAADFSTRAKCQ